MNFSIPVYGHIINGEMIQTGETIPVYNKYSGEVIALLDKADRAMVSRAIESASVTFKKEKLTPTQRYEILAKTSAMIKERREELAKSLMREVGKTIRDARVELERAINTFHIAAEESKRIAGHMVPVASQEGSENRLSFTIRVPVGVIGAITPFNFPFLLSSHKIAPAIAAGNAVVLKPAEITPITVMMLADILREAGLPPGWLNIINGLGHEAGQYLLEDERIAMYTFTGSAKIGRHIKNSTGIRKVTLELGSNAPNIIHHDAPDLNRAIDTCLTRGYSTSGQACISVQRLYVHESIYETVLKQMIARTQQLSIGDPAEETTDIGPLIAEKEAIRIEEWVDEAVKQGAKIACGGKREGAIYHPTILTGVSPEMKVMCQEVFAPVINVIPYADIDDAFREANDSEYGLQVGLFTSNLQLAMKAAHELEYGGVIINDASTYRSDLMPYGGIKNSGLGKEGPRYAIEEMTDERVIVMNL